MGLYFNNKMLKEYDFIQARLERLIARNHELLKLIMDVIEEMKGESIESTVVWGIELEKEVNKILFRRR